MTFEHFKSEIESQLHNTIKFELLEFHFLPHAFGSGLLVYRIKGQLHQFVFDGKDNQLSWYKASGSNKYTSANFELLQTFTGLAHVHEIVSSLT